MEIGIDEAGRGPVLGSMFVAAIAVPDSTTLPATVRDSKLIGDDEREALAERIEEVATVGVAEVDVRTIDDSKENLNALTLEAASEAARDVIGDSGGRVVADACDPDADRYARRLRSALPGHVDDVRAFHGADASEPVVAAASIIAKSRREAHVAGLRDAYGAVGSGYPGDETTLAFLRRYVEREGSLPPCARRSWDTSQTLLEEVDQTSLSTY